MSVIKAYQDTEKKTEQKDITGTSITDLNSVPRHLLDVFLYGTSGASFQVTGANIAGDHEEVTVPDNAWVALPGTALANRNAVNIQNNSGFEMKVNFDNGVGYEGMTIPDGGERQYAMTENVIIYGRMAPGSGSQAIDVEELS